MDRPAILLSPRRSERVSVRNVSPPSVLRTLPWIFLSSEPPCYFRAAFTWYRRLEPETLRQCCEFFSFRVLPCSKPSLPTPFHRSEVFFKLLAVLTGTYPSLRGLSPILFQPSESSGPRLLVKILISNSIPNLILHTFPYRFERVYNLTISGGER